MSEDDDSEIEFDAEAWVKRNCFQSSDELSSESIEQIVDEFVNATVSDIYRRNGTTLDDKQQRMRAPNEDRSTAQSSLLPNLENAFTEAKDDEPRDDEIKVEFAQFFKRQGSIRESQVERMKGELGDVVDDAVKRSKLGHFQGGQDVKGHIHRSEIAALKSNFNNVVDTAVSGSSCSGIDARKLPQVRSGIDYAIGGAIFRSTDLPDKSRGGITAFEVDNSLRKEVESCLMKAQQENAFGLALVEVLRLKEDLVAAVDEAVLNSALEGGNVTVETMDRGAASLTTRFEQFVNQRRSPCIDGSKMSDKMISNEQSVLQRTKNQPSFETGKVIPSTKAERDSGFKSGSRKSNEVSSTKATPDGSKIRARKGIWHEESEVERDDGPLK